MNYFGSWAKSSRCYERFRDMDDVNKSVSWAQHSRCYEQVKVVDDMNNSWSPEIRPLDAMNGSRLYKIWTILSREHQALNVMNTSRLWMTRTTHGHKLKALDDMNNSGLWLIWTIVGHKLRALVLDRDLKSMIWCYKFRIHYLFNDDLISLLPILIPCIILYEHSCLNLLHCTWLRCISTKLLHYIISQSWENIELVLKLVVALTYGWDCKLVIYSLWIGSLLMKANSNRYS